MLYVKESNQTVERTLEKLQKAAAANQLGILMVHDLKEKMTAKGVDFKPQCRIVELCNPKQAKKVLEDNMSISTALPCRISLYEQADKVKVATIKPTALLGLFGISGLESVAKEIEDAIIRVVDSACAT
jgi:uncharacterized protein (DUF302 family)